MTCWKIRPKPEQMTMQKASLSKISFIIAAVYGMTAVILAAMGSHFFNIERGSAQYLLFNNAVIFQILHAILLLWLSTFKEPTFWIRSAIVSLLAGILLFCGGLYILVIIGKTAISWVTPIGGSLLILAWLNLSIVGFKNFFEQN